MTGDDKELLAEQFERHRRRLHAVARRILGSAADADDAVQEAWLRFSRSGRRDVINLESWLTTVVSRVCLNMLQARRSQPQLLADPENLQDVRDPAEADPELEALLADSVGFALLALLNSLTPAERVAFVLHDVFSIPFDQIAAILERSTQATRQLASRARVRIRRDGLDEQADLLRQAGLVEAFLAAARHGDFESLISILDPSVVLRADDHALTLGAVKETRGAETVARLSLRASGATFALLDGAPAVAWVPGDKLRSVLRFGFRDDRITSIDVIADPDHLCRLQLLLPGTP